MKYQFISISTITAAAYVISFLLRKAGIISLGWHRKFWNIVLLLCFFGVAGIGMFMAFASERGIQVPALKPFLVSHVEFGIMMSVVALFHFLWHLNYYLHIFKGKNGDAPSSQ